MRVCTSIATGKLIEAQSDGDGDDDYRAANLDALRTNAINAGYAADDLDVRFVTDAEGAALLAAQQAADAISNPRASLVDQVLADPASVAKLKTALGIT